MCCIGFLFTGCKKFFDVRPNTSVVNPTTLKDFEEILNSDSLAICNFSLADLASDDVRMPDAMLASDVSSYYAYNYLWAKNIWNPGDQDFMYNSAYARILQMNIVLDRINTTEGSEQRKNVVRAQAQINRAWYYLQLANLYGLDYQSTTAATDLAVPLILTPDAGERPSRASVQQVYNQVLGDLNAAVANPDLPGMGQTIVHPGKAAGYALLARTYLYMGDYQQAEENADAALVIKDNLWNYNMGYVKPNNLLDISKDPETLFGKLGVDKGFFIKYQGMSFLAGPTLWSLLDSNDIRLTGNFDGGGGFIPSYTQSAMVFNYSISVPELMLIKAECMARRGEATDAIGLVNQLRQNRLVNYVPLDDTADALSTVLKERQRELFYHGGARLFDLKRLNRDNRFAQTLQRLADDGTTVLSTLAPSSPAYLIQFSPVIIANNPNMVQNLR